MTYQVITRDREYQLIRRRIYVDLGTARAAAEDLFNRGLDVGQHVFSVAVEACEEDNCTTDSELEY